jgi:uncharacterized protein YbjT (DUF2867 family)
MSSVKWPTLVVGGTGNTGRRVAERLRAHDLPVRNGSRSGEPPFDWEHPGRIWTNEFQSSAASNRP